MRRKTNLLSFDTDSALALMQEIYNDIVEQKQTASMITKKMLSFMKESEDMTIIGPVIKEQQKILNDCTEKKISLVKLQSAIMKQTGGNQVSSGGKLDLTEEDRVLLEKLMKEDDETSSGGRENYKM